MLRKLVAWVGVAFCASAMQAQVPADGAIRGVVTGAGGTALNNATVHVAASDLTYSAGAITRTDGTFALGALPAGDYYLWVSEGLHDLKIGVAVSVRPGQTTEVSLSVTSARMILTANAVADDPPTNPDENGDGLESARGLEPMQNGAALDGMSARQSYGSVPVGTGSDPAPDPDGDGDSAERTTGAANGMSRGRHGGMAYAFSQAAVREFHVAGKTYSAQTGRAGDVMSAVTRSGGSELHGSGFLTLRSQAFAAHDPLAIATSYTSGLATSVPVKPHDLRTSIGGSVGGRLQDFGE